MARINFVYSGALEYFDFLKLLDYFGISKEVYFERVHERYPNYIGEQY